MAPTSLQRKRQRSLGHLTLQDSVPPMYSPAKMSSVSNLPTRSLRSRRKRPERLPYYAGISLLMLLWDWKVLLATLAGVGTVVLLPTVQRYRWCDILQAMQKLWDSPHRPMAVAIASGGCVSALTYLSLQIWLETQSHWLAAGVILEGMGLSVVGAIGATALLSRRTTQSEAVFYEHLANLTDEEPITRLIAIRRLSDLACQRQLSPTQTQVVSDALALRLNDESEDRLRHAALDSLAVLRVSQSGSLKEFL